MQSARHHVHQNTPAFVPMPTTFPAWKVGVWVGLPYTFLGPVASGSFRVWTQTQFLKQAQCTYCYWKNRAARATRYRIMRVRQFYPAKPWRLGHHPLFPISSFLVVGLSCLGIRGALQRMMGCVLPYSWFQVSTRCNYLTYAYGINAQRFTHSEFFTKLSRNNETVSGLLSFKLGKGFLSSNASCTQHSLLKLL